MTQASLAKARSRGSNSPRPGHPPQQRELLHEEHEDAARDPRERQQDAVNANSAHETAHAFAEGLKQGLEVIEEEGLASPVNLAEESPRARPPPEQLPTTDCASVTSSHGSACSWFEMRFQLEADALRFTCFVNICVVFVCMYTLSASIAFFSSLYPVYDPTKKTSSPDPRTLPTSTVDAFVLTSSIIVIDITSALFVVVGFFSAFMIANIPRTDVFDLCKIIVVYVFTDVWICTLLSMLFGSIFHLTRHSFRAHDVALTLLEGITCLRVFEVSQAWQSMHSLNPTAWPVLCLLYAFMLTPFTIASNERLRSCHPQSGWVLMLCNASAPIVIISLFALVRDDTNIFFINATHVAYRLLEFNLGVCFYSFSQNYPRGASKVAVVLQWTFFPVLAAFTLVWWAQLGMPVRPSYETCIRMYYFSPCIQVHHGFLMRGCLLGLSLVCKILAVDTKNSDDRVLIVLGHTANLHKHGSWLTSALTSVLLIWPTCYVVHLMLEANFSLALVHDNAALLVLVIPVITFAVSFLWNSTWKIVLFEAIERFIDSVCTCLPARGSGEGPTAV
jgi:hypothetical protein